MLTLKHLFELSSAVDRCKHIASDSEKVKDAYTVLEEAQATYEQAVLSQRLDASEKALPRQE